MTTIIVRVLIVIAAYVLAYIYAQYLGAVYALFFPNAIGGGWIGAPGMLEWIRGLSITLIFLLTLFIHAVGGRNVWWWNMGALVPAVLFEIRFDPLHIYFPILVGVIAWILGISANKVLTRFAPSFMSKIS